MRHMLLRLCEEYVTDGFCLGHPSKILWQTFRPAGINRFLLRWGQHLHVALASATRGGRTYTLLGHRLALQRSDDSSAKFTNILR